MKAYFSLMGTLCPRIKQSPYIPISIFKSAITTFLIVFCFVFAAKAQEGGVHSPPVAKAENSSQIKTSVDEENKDNEITALKMGDEIPDKLWDIPLQIVNHPEGKETITLKDYEDKLIILDFWATWCSPCISSLRRLQDIQSKFGPDLMVIPTTYEPHEEASKLLSSKHIDLPSVFGENNKYLKAYFPHRVVPHQVWIKDGRVYAITDGKHSTVDNIDSVLTHQKINLREKEDLAIDHCRPISMYAKDREAPLYFQSTLTGFIDGAGGSGRITNDSLSERHFFNRPAIDLFRYTLKLQSNRLLLEIEDKEKFLNKEFDQKYLYSYQLIAPADSKKEDLNKKIVNDLNTYFRLYGRFEKRITSCYILKSNSKATDKTGASTLDRLVDLLNHSFGWQESLPIFLNETDGETVLPRDYNLLVNELKHNLKALKAYGKKHDFIVTKEEREIEFFVISDQIIHHKPNNNEL